MGLRVSDVITITKIREQPFNIGGEGVMKIWHVIQKNIQSPLKCVTKIQPFPFS